MKHRGFLVATLMVCVALVSAQGGGGGGQGRGGRGGFGGFGQMGRGGNNELGLALRKDVQTDLGVTEDQKKKLEELQAKQREARRGQGFGGGGRGGNGGGGNGGNGGGGAGQGGGFNREEMQKRMEEQRAQTRKDLAAILSEAQIKRLGEISIQLRGNNALLDPAIQKSVGLSTEQVTKIKELQTKQQEANQGLFEKVRNQEMTREEVQAAFEKNNKTMDSELAKVLTAEQTTKFKALGGKPFKADPEETNRRGGGGGGGR